MKYFTWFRPEQDFEYAKRVMKAGIAGFEALYRASYLDPEIQSAYVENLRRIKGELGASFSVHAPSHDVSLGSLNARVREASFEEIRESIHFARTIGASVVVVHPTPGILGMPEGKWSHEEQPPRREVERIALQEEYIVQAVRELADYAPDILLCMENLVYPHEIYRTPEQMAGLIKKVNRSNVGLTLDVGHAVVCDQKPTDFLHLLQESIFHVHLHDNNGVVDQHLPLGKGNIDYVAVIRSLKQIGYDGVVNLEFLVENPDDYHSHIYRFE